VVPQNAKGRARGSPDIDAGAVLTKAVMRATALLGLSQQQLAQVLGVSRPTVTRMGLGTYRLGPSQPKSWELGTLFVRMFRALDALVGHAELRFFDNDVRHPHPAACDEEFGLAARAGAQFGNAFGKADGIGHGERAEARPGSLRCARAQPRYTQPESCVSITFTCDSPGSAGLSCCHSHTARRALVGLSSPAMSFRQR